MRGEIAEAAVELRVLIKANANIIKEVFPDATLTQIVDTPKREFAELGTQNIQNMATPPPLPSTSCMEEFVLDFNFRFAGPPTSASYDDDDDDEDDDVAGAVNKGDVRTFTRKSFGVIARSYLSPYV
jgi:hypothetical protein